MIYEGKIKYGEIYFINDIAAKLKMSRTPVRDAIHMLSDENRIDILPSRGFRLHYITEDEIQQMYHYSRAIEGYCAACLAIKFKLEGSCSHIAQLKDLFEKMRDSDLDHISFGDFYFLDNEWHRVLIESLFSDLRETGFFDRPEIHLIENFASKLEILQAHQNVLEAIYAGDSDGAYSAMLSHADLVFNAYKYSNKHDDSDNL
jgi:DNA-binding GntR family transcriptional regulator